jgi:hypothetical protein
MRSIVASSPRSAAPLDALVDPPRDRIHLGRGHPTRRDGGGAEPEPGGIERFARIERDGVVVSCDVSPVERLRGDLSRDVLRG